MGEHPSDGDRSPGTEDENARLELPSLRLPRFGRRRKPRDEGEPVEQPALVPDVDVGAHTDAVPTAPSEPTAAFQAHDETDQARDTEEVDEPAARRTFTLPTLPARVAAVLTGAVVGIIGVALTYLSLQGCNAVRGTKSCGGGAGLLLLVVILVLMVLVGGVLLALLGVPDARSTSFLGVGVLTVVALLVLMPQLYSVWMFLVVPVVCALSYLLAHWVTTAFVEPRPERGPQHDIR